MLLNQLMALGYLHFAVTHTTIAENNIYRYSMSFVFTSFMEVADIKKPWQFIGLISYAADIPQKELLAVKFIILYYA